LYVLLGWYINISFKANAQRLTVSHRPSVMVLHLKSNAEMKCCKSLKADIDASAWGYNKGSAS